MKTKSQHSKLICIDPGTVTGWSVFVSGKLVSCGHGNKSKLLGVLVSTIIPKTTVLIERPRAYPGRKSRAPCNDLLELDHLAGQYESLYRLNGAYTSYVYPRNWKGNTPKPTSGEIYLVEERVLTRLDESELVALQNSQSTRTVNIDHNKIDAIGMGLWHLDRWI